MIKPDSHAEHGCYYFMGADRVSEEVISRRVKKLNGTCFKRIPNESMPGEDIASAYQSMGCLQSVTASILFSNPSTIQHEYTRTALNYVDQSRLCIRSRYSIAPPVVTRAYFGDLKKSGIGTSTQGPRGRVVSPYSSTVTVLDRPSP